MMSIQDNGTQVEPAELDLTDALSQAWDANAEAEAATEQPRGDDGKFTASDEATESAPAESKETGEASDAAEDAAGEETDTPEVEASKQAETPAIEAPKHWSDADKATFAKAPDEIKSWMLERHKAMEADYTRKTQDLADERRLASEFQRTVAPYEAIIRAEGATPMMAFADLLNTAYLLRTGTPEQKIALIRETAQQFGVDLSQINAEAEYRDPQLASIETRLSRFEQSEQQKQQEALAQRHQSVAQQVESFKAQTNADGTPKYPHFDTVRVQMGALMQAATARGEKLSMEQAYEDAVFANPETRKSVLTAKEQSEAKQREEARKAKAAQARKAAGVNVNGKQQSASAPKTLAEEMSALWDQQVAAS